MHRVLRFCIGCLAAQWAWFSTAHAIETQRLYLSGTDKDHTVPWRFFCTSGAHSGVWTNLPVPSHWDMKGFGTLTYKKDATNAWDERGLYEHDFEVPPEWNDQRVFLVFEGVMTDTSAKINGESVGPTHQGGFYRFKYEVTRLVRFGTTNRLEVEVARHSANESVNKAERLADYWVFAGIYRPVYLEAEPESFIERVAIDAKADGTFAMKAFANGARLTDFMEAQVLTLDGRPVGEPFQAAMRVADAGLSYAQFGKRITSPKPWTAETPNLYNVEVRLKRGGETIHSYKQRFGFRTFEVRDGDGLYLNGQKIILKGVNRHSFWPDSGRCLSEAVHRLDIETIKEMNGNAVRMSHYPPDVEFLDLCDELGLYVLDELAGWHNHYDTTTGVRLVEAMVTRDVNHPSILFWDNGNEGGFNTNLDAVFPRFDPQQRRVLHPWAPFSGINTAHYLAYSNAMVAASGEPMYYQPKANDEVLNPNLPNRWIYMPTEFMHGLYDGGAGAGLADYWSMMMSHSNCAGGFIWVFADEGIKRPDTGEIDTAGNQAPDGIVGPYREREGSFFAIQQLWSPIQVERGTNGTFTVENRYSFTDASNLWLEVTVHTAPDYRSTNSFRAWGMPPGWSPFPDNKVIASSPLPPIGPGERKTLDQLSNFIQYGGAGPIYGRHNLVALNIMDQRRRAVSQTIWETKPISFTSRSQPNIQKMADLGGDGDFELVDNELLELKSAALTVRFKKGTGELIEVVKDGERYSLSWRGVVGADGPAITTWKLRPDGWLKCHFKYTATDTNDAIGVAFDYPEPLVKHKRWLGDGPYRVWKNRLGGGTLGVWENDYNNTITGYRDWVYPEFKGFYANVRWLQLETTEGLITVVPENIPFVQVLTPEMPPDSLVGQTKVNIPQCGLGFLHAIPPIGSKFKPANTTGPQGEPNIGQGEYSGTVSFYFGKLP